MSTEYRGYHDANQIHTCPKTSRQSLSRAPRMSETSLAPLVALYRIADKYGGGGCLSCALSPQTNCVIRSLARSLTVRHIVDAVQIAGALLVEQVLRLAAHDLQRIRAVEQLARFAAPGVCFWFSESSFDSFQIGCAPNTHKPNTYPMCRLRNLIVSVLGICSAASGSIRLVCGMVFGLVGRWPDRRTARHSGTNGTVCEWAEKSTDRLDRNLGALWLRRGRGRSIL